MRNCLILGSGRSGTSLAAGMLSQAGYFIGERPYPGDVGNPKGYFEDKAINGLNEELLAPVVPGRPGGRWGDLLFRSRPVMWQRWLAVVPAGTAIPRPAHLAERMRGLLARAPYCFKDPRFSYTLPAWRPLLRDCAFICVFRHPATTAASIVTECRRDATMRNFAIDTRGALRVWQSMYSHILDVHLPAGGEWLFVHYMQLLDGSACHKLETLLGMTVDRTFADPGLRRTEAQCRIAIPMAALYERLCKLAGYTESDG
jgi:hypothetical protein